MSFTKESSLIDISHNETPPISKNKGGKLGWFGWGKYAKKLNEINPSHWHAECLSCHIIWPKGSPQEIEIHLAFECQKVEPSVRDFFLQQLAVKTIDQDSTETNIHKKQKKYDSTRQKKITEFESMEDQTNHTLVKAFVICEILWHIIENPFFIEFLKTLKSSYLPPSKEVLSERLLAQEAAIINQQVIKDLTNQKNLTLSDFLAEQIEEVIDKIRANKFSAIVSDISTNIKLTRHHITEKYSYMLNIRCIAHAINLISKNI